MRVRNCPGLMVMLGTLPTSNPMFTPGAARMVPIWRRPRNLTHLPELLGMPSDTGSGIVMALPAEGKYRAQPISSAVSVRLSVTSV
ncbi:hypothetical protein D3C81_1541930 [compost metagenome]